MILALTAVSDKYVDLCSNNLHLYRGLNWDIKVLTDKPQKFKKVKTYTYTNKVFNFFDKLYFALNLSIENKQPVVMLDTDCMTNLGTKFTEGFNPKNTDKIIIPNYWPGGKIFRDYRTDKYFEPIVEYWKNIGVKPYVYNNLMLPHEWFFYFPYSEKLINLSSELTRIKPVFDKTSIDRGNPKKGIGSAEGLALSYAMYKVGLHHQLLDIKYYNNKN